MVEALPAVLARHPEARLVVAGRVYYDVFLRRAEELGIAYAVRPLGAVPKAVSYTHLDVYKRQQRYFLYLRKLPNQDFHP